MPTQHLPLVASISYLLLCNKFPPKLSSLRTTNMYHLTRFLRVRNLGAAWLSASGWSCIMNLSQDVIQGLMGWRVCCFPCNLLHSHRWKVAENQRPLMTQQLSPRMSEPRDRNQHGHTAFVGPSHESHTQSLSPCCQKQVTKSSPPLRWQDSSPASWKGGYQTIWGPHFPGY